jgi:Ala-tRNA(Pro) deacylase
MEIFEKIRELLANNRIEYTLTEHGIVKTSEEAAAVRGVELKSGAKAMLVKTKVNNFLFVLPADKKVDWRKVKEILGVKDASLMPPDEAEELTGLKMGSVPPFGNVLGIKTYFDKGILDNEKVNFNPGSLTHSIQMKPEDLVELIKPEIVEFSK